MSVVNEDDDDAVNAVSNNVPVEQFDDDLDDLAISELFDNLNINETGDESGSVYEYVVNLFNHENEFIQQFEATEVDNDLMIAPLFEEIDTHEAHNDFNHVNDLNIGDGGIENESAFQNVENSELSGIATELFEIFSGSKTLKSHCYHCYFFNHFNSNSKCKRQFTK